MIVIFKMKRQINFSFKTPDKERINSEIKEKQIGSDANQENGYFSAI